MTPIQKAQEYIDGIIDGSPEDDARIWFENAPHIVRLAAFIKLDAEDQRRAAAFDAVKP